MRNVLLTGLYWFSRVFGGDSPIRLTPRKVAVGVCCALLFANMAVAQKTVRYEGAMPVPKDLAQMRQFLPWFSDDKGEGYYDYYENADGDRVKHGQFMFIHKYSVSVWQVLYGQYKDGKKTGVWVVKDSIVTKQRIKKYELYNVHATYANDSLNGSFVCKKYKSGRKYTLECSFKNGRMIGEVSITLEPTDGKTSTLKGKMDETGLPTGIWTNTDKIGIEVIQKRLYKQGVCVYVEEKNQATGERYMTYSVFDDVTKMSAAEAMTVGEGGLEYNGQIAKKKAKVNSEDGWSNISYTTQGANSSSAKYEIGTLLYDIIPSNNWLGDNDVLGEQVQKWNWHYEK